MTELLETVWLQAGRMVLDEEQADVADMVTKAVGHAQAATSRHNIVLKAPPELKAKLDALRFARVVSVSLPAS